MSNLSITKHTIRVESIPRFEQLVVEHNRKILKLNKRHNASLLKMSFTVVATREVTKEEVEAQYDLRGELFDAAVRPYPAGTIVADIHLSGERPILAGWAIAGVLTATDEGYLVSRVRDTNYADVAPFAARGGDCDHCKSSRRRTTTYLLKNGEDASIKVIGSTCLKDFTGHPSPALLVAYADYSVAFDKELEELEDEERESSGRSGGGGQRAMSLVKYLGFVRSTIRQFGWVSKGQAFKTGERSTSGRAWEDVSTVAQLEWAIGAHPEQEAIYYDQLLKVCPTDVDNEKASEDLSLVDDTFSAEESPDDFQTNTLAVVRQGFAFGKNLGLAAAICRAADRIRGDISKREERAKQVDEHFGTVGLRETWRLKCVYTTDLPGYMGGTTQLCIFVDAAGRKAKWFNSGKFSLDKGTTYDVKGTVKKHDVYEGKCITMLSRCAVTEVPEASESAEAAAS